jgi:hypothetical protein
LRRSIGNLAAVGFQRRSCEREEKSAERRKRDIPCGSLFHLPPGDEATLCRESQREAQGSEGGTALLARGCHGLLSRYQRLRVLAAVLPLMRGRDVAAASRAPWLALRAGTARALAALRLEHAPAAASPDARLAAHARCGLLCCRLCGKACC